MKQVIYLDVLLAVNLFINYFLLLGTACFISRPFKRYRLLLSALAGSIFSLIILLDSIPALFLWGIKLLLAFLLILIAFGYGGIALYLKRTFLFFTVNFVFAGAMTGLFLFASPKGMILHNGTVYFQISALLLAVGTVAAYGVIKLVTYLIRQRTDRNQVISLKIQQNGRQQILRGLGDTGNRLCDPISGDPVIVCSLENVKDLVPPEILPGLYSGDWGEAAQCAVKQNFKLRAVPYHTVGNQGMLPCFIPEYLALITSGGKEIPVRALIGISRQSVSQGEYEAVIHAELLSEIK